MSDVIVVVDPQRKSVTIEAIDGQGKKLANGRFGTPTPGTARRCSGGTACRQTSARSLLNLAGEKIPRPEWIQRCLGSTP